jgi:hypothetical protein
MDHIETIKTYRAVSTGIWDRHLQSEVVKEVEGYAFRCKICGYISLNHKEVQLHKDCNASYKEKGNGADF